MKHHDNMLMITNMILIPRIISVMTMFTMIMITVYMTMMMMMRRRMVMVVVVMMMMKRRRRMKMNMTMTMIMTSYLIYNIMVLSKHVYINKIMRIITHNNGIS